MMGQHYLLFRQVFYSNLIEEMFLNLLKKLVLAQKVFYIPFGTFKPYTAIETRLLVIKKKAQSDFIFEGQLSFNKKRDQNLINNFYSFKEDHDPELGFLRRFKGNVDLKEVIFFEKLSLINKNIDLEVKHLEDISENIIYATYETIDNPNSIFIF